MLPPEVNAEAQRIDARILIIDGVIDNVDMTIQSVFANHVIIAGAGFVEKGVNFVLSEYARRNGNGAMRRYVQKTIERNNSLNCEKIKIIVDRFDATWWPEFDGLVLPAERAAVNSLKDLRDQVAHGNFNGTGYSTAKTYYGSAKRYIQKMGDVILR